MITKFTRVLHNTRTECKKAKHTHRSHIGIETSIGIGPMISGAGAAAVVVVVRAFQVYDSVHRTHGRTRAYVDVE